MAWLALLPSTMTCATPSSEGLLVMARRAYASNHATCTPEPDLNRFYTPLTAPNISNNIHSRFRSDFSVVVNGPGPDILGEVKVLGTSTAKVMDRLPDSLVIPHMAKLDPTVFKNRIRAVSRLGPIPPNCPTQFVPGLKPYHEGYTPVTFFGEEATIQDQYFKRFSGIDPKNLYVLVFDSAGGFSPRVNDLRRSLSRGIHDSNDALGLPAEPWWIYFRESTVRLSTTLHRRLAERRIECRRMAVNHTKDLADPRRAGLPAYHYPRSGLSAASSAASPSSSALPAVESA